MKIQLSEKVFLESDSMQFIIKKYTGTINEKTQKENVVNLGYYSSFKSALKDVVKKDLLEAMHVNDIYDVLGVLRTIEHKIDNIITEVKP